MPPGAAMVRWAAWGGMNPPGAAWGRLGQHGAAWGRKLLCSFTFFCKKNGKIGGKIDFLPKSNNNYSTVNDF
jgi:hypothetical protein